MTDLYTRIREQPREVLDAVGTSLNVRASEPAMQAICARYMAQIAPPAQARVLEIGSGTGATTKLMMRHLHPAHLVGIDPSPAFLDMARETFAVDPRVSFAVGEAGATGQPDTSFDLVIAHTVYSHLLDPEGALGEARRVLKPGGQLAIFDGGFETLTVALFEGDRLRSTTTPVLRIMCKAPSTLPGLPLLAPRPGFAVG